MVNHLTQRPFHKPTNLRYSEKMIKHPIAEQDNEGGSWTVVPVICEKPVKARAKLGKEFSPRFILLLANIRDSDKAIPKRTGVCVYLCTCVCGGRWVGR